MTGPTWILGGTVLLFILASASCLDEEPEAFIIRTSNDLKPSEFEDIEQWYTSIVRSVNNEVVDTNRTSKNPLIHAYKTVFHGFAARLTVNQAEQLKSAHGVLQVFPNQMVSLHTTRTPQFLGLDTRDKNGVLNESNFGEDTIIGILDSGITPDHPSFHDEGLGPIPARWKGTCQDGENWSKNQCNKKIIGARFFLSDKNDKINGEVFSPLDTSGHGTHVASIAAGRLVRNASLGGFAAGDACGVAPKARLAIYKTCAHAGCAAYDIIAGMDAAVVDGVDVLSLSMGHNNPSYNLDPIAIAGFTATKYGVFVSTSAGNSGPAEGSVENIAPWLTTVGASSIDRDFPTDLILGDGTIVSGQSFYTGPPLPKDTFFPIHDASMDDVFDMDSAMVRGKIMFYDLNVTKVAVEIVPLSNMVRDAGGVGVVVGMRVICSNGEKGSWLQIPGMKLYESETEKVIRYMNTTRSPHGTIRTRGTELNVQPAPVLASFSSRGPNPRSLYILKPDLIAPGINILAAWPKNIVPTGIPGDNRTTEFYIASGTSMSCPHVSGVAAILKGSHPDWSPAMIRSAMMTTAYTHDVRQQPLVDECGLDNTATAWEIGAGHVDPQKALDPGLVYDLRTNDYLKYLCNANYSAVEIGWITNKTVTCGVPLGKEWDLNYPAISVVIDMTNRRSPYSWEIVHRTVTYVGQGVANYTLSISEPEMVKVAVEPMKLSFQKNGEKKSYIIKVLAGSVILEAGYNKTNSGSLVWSDGKHNVTSRLLVVWNNPQL